MTLFSDDELRRIKATQQPKRSIVTVNLAGVAPRKMPFLWYPYLPLGRVVIVAGAPGHGKSQFSSMIAGMATRAALYPGDVLEPSRVLMLSAEDDLAATVVPRLMAVNADLNLIDTINVVTEYPGGLTATGLIRLPGDFESIYEWAKAYVNARLVVLDPVASFFDREHNTLFNQDIRDALAPLVAVAENYGITIVIVLHLNKSESKDFAARIAESHGFQALARSVMALGPDPDDPGRERGSKKVIALTKANLVKPGTYSMRCEVRSVTLPGTDPPIETSELVLTGKCDLSADDLLISSSDRSTRIEAGGWLDEFLNDGWRKVADVRKAAISDGFAWRMIERIRAAGGYQRIKQPGVQHGPWWIGAPRAHVRDLPPASGGVGDLDQDRQLNGLGDLDGLGDLGGVEDPRQPRPPEAGGGSRGRAREGDDSPNGQSNLDDYRRLRDRMLGEDDDGESGGNE